MVAMRFLLLYSMVLSKKYTLQDGKYVSDKIPCPSQKLNITIQASQGNQKSVDIPR